MRPYFSLERFSPKKIDIAAPWILFVLVVWLCWKIAALIWLMIAPPQAPLARDIPLTGQSATVVPNITGFSLFKENQANLSAQNTEPQLPLKLEGIFLAIPASQSAAVIRVNNVSSRYKVGQQLEGTSQRLAGVAWDHIRLSYANGRESTLYFGDQAANPVSGLNTPAVAVTPANQPQNAQTAIGDAIRQLQSNPAGYLNQMGVQASGQGYEVTATAPQELRNKLGLRPGDRIVSLNGRPLGQVQNDIRVLEQIQQQRNAQIEIRRGEQTMTIQQNF